MFSTHTHTRTRAHTCAHAHARTHTHAHTHTHIYILHQNAVLCGDGLNLHQTTFFMILQKDIYGRIVGKEVNAGNQLVTSIISFSHHVFYFSQIKCEIYVSFTLLDVCKFSQYLQLKMFLFGK